MSRISIFIFSFLLLSSQQASAELSFATLKEDTLQFLDKAQGWHIAGENSVYMDYYDSHGNDSATRYPFDGYQAYLEQELNFDRKISDYESVEGSISHIVNWNDYRSIQQGWTVEDLRLQWQKGDGVVPFRANLGDYSASLTYRTIQRSLKGVHVELQPEIKVGNLEQKHSLIAFTGITEPIYRDVQFNKDLFSGFSWLMNFAKFGAASFNFVHNFRDNDPDAITQQRQQLVWSFTYEKILKLLTQTLSIEAEVAKFIGDYDSFSSRTGVEKDKSDTGTYFSIDGWNETPLTYGFSYESYGDDFQPHGSVVSSNQRSFEWNTGWAFDSGMKLDGRVEIHRDNLETLNRLDTKVYALSLAGPVANPILEDLTIYADISRRSRNDVSRFNNNRTWNYVFDTNATLYEKWRGHFGVNASHTRNEFFGDKYIRRQYVADVSHPVSFEDIKGNAKVGLTFRSNSGSIISSDEFAPMTAINLRKDNHNVDFYAGLMNRDSHVFRSQNNFTFNVRGNYGYEIGAHRLALNAEINGRNPSTVKGTQDYHFGLRYTFSFDKPADVSPSDFTWRDAYLKSKRKMKKQNQLEVSGLEYVASGIPWLAATQPGMSFKRVIESLEKFGLRGGRAQGDYTIYEHRVFNNLANRQRFVVESDAGFVTRSAVLINFSQGASARDAEQAFLKVQKILLDHYGQPSSNREEGQFTTNYAPDINSGQLVRVMQWNTPSGVIRFGVPRRLDGQVRMEIQQAQAFPSTREAHWSLGQVV